MALPGAESIPVPDDASMEPSEEVAPKREREEGSGTLQRRLRMKFGEAGVALAPPPAPPVPATSSGSTAAEAGAIFFTSLEDAEAEYEDVDGSVRQLTHEECGAFTTLLAAAGAETTAKLLGHAVFLLWQHRDQRQMLWDDSTRIPNAMPPLRRP